ncbi:MAG: aldo/keto reductase [Candidatus Brennerbacteria bacterium]|nr:aldo/keto reductase [Candidatus Brennerbacteria bacterium]
MNYRTLGATGISVSEIGFGTWGIGGLTEGATSYGETDDAVSLRALARALELGMNFYDTSNIYGHEGHAEALLGEAFGNQRERVVLATKVGCVKHGGPYDVSPSYIRSCLEASLRRLKTDYVDVYQLHSVPLELVRETPECFATLRELKKEGKIRAIGYSVKNPSDAKTAIEEFGVDVVQLNFNMMDQRALTEGIFDVARVRGVGIIVRTPFAFGFLTGKVTDTQFDSRDHRSVWSPAQLARWRESPNVFSPVNDKGIYTPAQFALKFCVAFPEVSTVVAGMLTETQAEENATASDLPPLTAAQLAAIRKIREVNTFFVSEKK